MTNGTPDFPPTKLLKYPHMFALDIAIWERWLDRFATDFDGFSYDVKVGSGTPPAPDLREPFITMQSTLSKYRIDALGFKSDSIHVIEVKPDAGTIAFGQLETYIPLYIRDFNPTLPVFGIVVTDRPLPDMPELMAARGHRYDVV